MQILAILKEFFMKLPNDLGIRLWCTFLPMSYSVEGIDKIVKHSIAHVFPTTYANS